MQSEARLREDFFRFSALQLDSGDIDPAYPLLSAFLTGRELETSLWALALFVAHYHLGSFETAFAMTESDWARPLPPLPTGVERRGFRGASAKLSAHLAAVRQHRPLALWLSDALPHGWDAVRSQYELLPFCGPWSSYKWADLLANVLSLPLVATSIGETGGPVETMARFPGATPAGLLAEGRARGVAFRGLDQVETCLCDFGSLLKGHYYPGHDIDQMMSQLGPASAFWRLRRATFRPEHLGEIGGWSGIRKGLLRRYADSGGLA